MGAWGYKNFENDTAADWFSDLQDSPTKNRVFPYLLKVLGEKEFIDDDESFITFAIIEALCSKLRLIQSEAVLPEISDIDTVLLIEMSIKAGKKLLFFAGHSELRELWEETEDFHTWLLYEATLIYKLEHFYNRYKFISKYSLDDNIEHEWNQFKKNNLLN